MEDLEFIFRKAHRELRPRTPLPEIEIEFFPFTGLNHTARLHQNRLSIRISDLFRDAPVEIYYSLALILLAKLYRRRIDASHHRIYRTFILTDEIQQRARAARHQRSRTNIPGARGRYVDLQEIFDRLNQQYFGSGLAVSRLSWSAKRARHVLGRYDAASNTIFVSRLFDSPEVPTAVTEYIVFHEMLHVKHQSRVQDLRFIVHTPEFRAEERRFPCYEEARQWLKRI
jgi:predicted metal-dependent hydrolase